MATKVEVQGIINNNVYENNNKEIKAGYPDVLDAGLNYVLKTLLDYTDKDAVSNIIKAYTEGARYFWANEAQRTSQAGMLEGEKGYQVDTARLYEYQNTPPLEWVDIGGLSQGIPNPNLNKTFIQISETINLSQDYDEGSIVTFNLINIPLSNYHKFLFVNGVDNYDFVNNDGSNQVTFNTNRPLLKNDVVVFKYTYDLNYIPSSDINSEIDEINTIASVNGKDIDVNYEIDNSGLRDEDLVLYVNLKTSSSIILQSKEISITIPSSGNYSNNFSFLNLPNDIYSIEFILGDSIDTYTITNLTISPTAANLVYTDNSYRQEGDNYIKQVQIENTGESDGIASVVFYKTGGQKFYVSKNILAGETIGLEYSFELTLSTTLFAEELDGTSIGSDVITIVSPVIIQPGSAWTFWKQPPPLPGNVYKESYLSAGFVTESLSTTYAQGAARNLYNQSVICRTVFAVDASKITGATAIKLKAKIFTYSYSNIFTGLTKSVSFKLYQHNGIFQDGVINSFKGFDDYDNITEYQSLVQNINGDTEIEITLTAGGVSLINGSSSILYFSMISDDENDITKNTGLMKSSWNLEITY